MSDALREMSLEEFRQHENNRVINLGENAVNTYLRMNFSDEMECFRCTILVNKICYLESGLQLVDFNWVNDEKAIISDGQLYFDHAGYILEAELIKQEDFAFPFGYLLND